MKVNRIKDIDCEGGVKCFFTCTPPPYHEHSAISHRPPYMVPDSAPKTSNKWQMTTCSVAKLNSHSKGKIQHV
jgi:hypothetical protein